MSSGKNSLNFGIHELKDPLRNMKKLRGSRRLDCILSCIGTNKESLLECFNPQY